MRFACGGPRYDDREQQTWDPRWGTMRPGRYTRIVGHWSVRLVSIVLTMMLGGGSSVASLCSALCFDDADSASAVAPGADTSTHHHGASRDGHPATITQAEHHHDTSAHSEPAAELGAGSTVSMSCAGDCCEFLSRPRHALAADRAHSGLVPALSGTAPSAAFARHFDHHVSWVTHGSPPGDTSARFRVVLRI
jgi:hypothetical protein